MKLPILTYRVVLRLYPASFRREFADDMTQFFVDRLAEAKREGGAGCVIRCWSRSLYDATVQALRERIHVRRRIRSLSMTHPARRHAQHDSSGRGAPARRERQQHMGNLLQDLRYAVRTLIKAPAFTIVTVLTLGLGVGANTAIFSVIYGVLLKPLPYTQSEQLVRTFTRFPGLGFDYFWLSWGQYLWLREQNHAFSELAAYRNSRASNLSAIDTPTRIQGVAISATLLPTLGVTPLIGRNFTAEEDLPGGAAVVVISHGLWQREFGGTLDVLERTIQLDGLGTRIIGVLPRGFRLPTEFDAPDPAQLFTPLALDPAAVTNVGSHNYNVVGRLRSGSSVESADASVKQMARYMRDTFNFPDDFSGTAVALVDRVVGDVRPALFVLLGTVGFVLLIACANVANLLLARAEARHREVAVRMALGAGRGRLLRQLLTESMLLSLAGGALAIGFAVFGVKALLAVDPTSIPRADAVALNLPVLGFTIVLSVITGLLFGVVPSLHATTPDVQSVLKEGDRGATVGGTRLNMRRGLAISEIALALLLVVGAGLMVKSFWILSHVDPGLDPERVLTVNVSLPPTTYADAPSVTSFYDRALERVNALPGVRNAALISTLQFARNNYDWTFRIEGRQTPPGEIGPNADYRLVSQGYFRAMGTPLIRGRAFTAFDRDSANPAIVINETMARKFWPDEDAIGKRVGLTQNVWHEVIGIVGDVRSRGLVEEPRPEMFMEQQQTRVLIFNASTFNLVIRTASDPLAMAGAVRSIFREMDPEVPVGGVGTVEQLVAESISRERFSMLLLAIFAAVALTLAAIGIYGVMSYSVAQRTHELGIRMALGADASAVRALVLRQGMGVAGIGLVIGVALAVGMTRLLEGLLYGVSVTDPAIFVGVPLLLGGVALVSNYLPALRASRGDPLVALREE